MKRTEFLKLAAGGIATSLVGITFVSRNPKYDLHFTYDVFDCDKDEKFPCTFSDFEGILLISDDPHSEIFANFGNPKKHPEMVGDHVFFRAISERLPMLFDYSK